MTKSQSIAQKRTDLRQQLFPEITENDLWSRARSPGWTSVPRAMPLLLTLMDRMSKGKPVSATYLELWCRMFEQCFVKLQPRDMAFHAGFSGQRAEQTWSERIRILEKLGFVKTQAGPGGELSYAVLFNPYLVIKRHFKKKAIGLDDAAYHALLERVNEIGAKDLDDGPPPRKAPPVPTLNTIPLPRSKAGPPPRTVGAGA